MTKKRFSLFAIVLAAFVLFVGCKKEQNTTETSAKNYYNSVQSKVPYSDIYVREKGCKGENGSSSILVFSSMNALIATTEDLDNQVEALDSIFYARNQNLSDNERADLQEAINYDASTPITAFNTFLQFNSLFQEIKGQEDVWLANDSLDLPNDPDNHFIFEESLRAVLNTDCEVQIADTIYKFVPTGYYSIPVSQSRNDRALVELAGSIYYHGNDDCDECKSSDCFSGKYHWEYVKSNDNQKMIKCSIGHLTYLRRYVTASVTNYKKRNWGIGWKKYSTYCEVKVYGKVSGESGDCSTSVNFNPNNVKKTSQSSKSLTHKIYVKTKTKSGWVKGYYYGANGIDWDKELD